MAEATLTAETEVTPPNDAALLTPDSTTEAAPPPEDQEEDTSHIDAFLEEIGRDDAETVGDDGKPKAPDGVVPPAEVAQTPEQIREDERKKVQTEQQQRDAQAQAQRYIDGLTWTVTEDAPAKLEALADLEGLSAEGRTALRNEINRIKGAFKPLLDRAIAVDQTIPQVKSAAYNEAATFTFDAFTATAKTELGDAAYKALTETKHDSWADVAGHLIKEARKGYVPADAVTKGQKKVLDRIDTALKGRGMSLKDITGNGGSDLPPIRGAQGRMTKAQFDDLSIDEQAKVSPAERARIYGAVR